MKKFLIIISPLCIILFTFMWIVLGLKEMLIFFAAILFAVVLTFGFVKWVEFVNRHIKD